MASGGIKLNVMLRHFFKILLVAFAQLDCFVWRFSLRICNALCNKNYVFLHRLELITGLTNV